MKAELLALSLAAASALSIVLPARASVAPSAALPAAGTPWWAPFQDPVLDRLAGRAAGGGAAQAAVVRSYIEQRTARLREGLAEKLLKAAEQQHELLAQTTEESDERARWLAALAARAEHWRGVQQFMAGERERSEATLAALTRTEPASLREQLAAGAGALPEVGLPVPDRLPVADDESAAQLQALQAGVTQALQARQLVQASELELRSRQLRQDAGASSVLDVLEAYQRLVADADRLAALGGAVAVAWSQLLQGSAGRAVAGLAAP